jgi:hypothetical protein
VTLLRILFAAKAQRNEGYLLHKNGITKILKYVIFLAETLILRASESEGQLIKS